MRILHAADFGGVAPGGFIPMICALGRLLQTRGDAFALAVPAVEGASWYDAVRDAGAELHVVDGARTAARFAAAWRPDVAHLHFFGWEVAVTLALWRSRAQILWHAHSSSLRGGLRATPRSLLKYRGAGMRVAKHIAVSRAVAEEIVLRGAPRNRVIVVPNAVDPMRFRPPTESERAASRAALGLGDGPAVLFYGRDRLLKGADVLAAALERVNGLTVVTVATPQSTRDELGRHARVIGIERTDDLRPLLWAVDALAMPSRGEGSPLAFIEAVSTGLPVAASDLPAFREAGEGYEAVWYAAPGDADALARALGAAVAARHPVPPPNTYDPNAWAARVVALYGAQSLPRNDHPPAAETGT